MDYGLGHGRLGYGAPLTHLYTHSHTLAGYGLVYLEVCNVYPSRHGPAACSSGAGLVCLLGGCAAWLEVEIAECLTVGLSDWRMGNS